MSQAKQKRQIVKKLQRRFGGAKGHLHLLKRLVGLGFGKIDLVEEYEKMASWCASKNNKKASVLRFNKWIKKGLEYKYGTDAVDNWDEEEKKTRERIKELS